MLENTSWKFDAVQESIDALAEAGFPAEEHFPRNVKIGLSLDRLARFESRFSREAQAAMDTAAERLFGQMLGVEPSYESVVEGLLTAAMVSHTADLDGTPTVRDQVLRTIDRVENRLAGQYIAAYKRDNCEQLRALVAEALQTLTEKARANVIDVGLQSLEAATRAGVADRWLALEQVAAAVEAIEDVARVAIKEKFLRDTGLVRYSVIDGASVDDLLDNLPDGGARGVHFAAMVCAGVELRMADGEAWEQHQRAVQALRNQSNIAHLRRQREDHERRKALETEAEADFVHPKPA